MKISRILAEGRQYNLRHSDFPLEFDLPLWSRNGCDASECETPDCDHLGYLVLLEDTPYNRNRYPGQAKHYFVSVHCNCCGAPWPRHRMLLRLPPSAAGTWTENIAVAERFESFREASMAAIDSEVWDDGSTYVYDGECEYLPFEQNKPVIAAHPGEDVD